jgi:hypothetical protein
MGQNSRQLFYKIYRKLTHKLVLNLYLYLPWYSPFILIRPLINLAPSTIKLQDKFTPPERNAQADNTKTLLPMIYSIL